MYEFSNDPDYPRGEFGIVGRKVEVPVATKYFVGALSTDVQVGGESAAVEDLVTSCGD